MKRKDFLAIIPGALIAIKVKIEPEYIIRPDDYKCAKPALLSSLERHEYSNLAIKQAEYLYFLRKGMVTPNEIRENEVL